MTPLEAAYTLFPPGSERFLGAVDFALESDSAAVWERTWKDETWWKDGEDTGGWS